MNIFKKIDVVELAVVVVTGAALIACVFMGQQEAVLALGGGLVGYLGGVSVGGGSAPEE